MLMRTRNKQLLIRLSEEEYKSFKKEVEKSGLKMNTYFIKLVNKNTIKERPPQDYAQIVYELSKIGNNINQLAYKANKTNYAAVEYVQTAVLLMERCWEVVKGLE